MDIKKQNKRSLGSAGETIALDFLCKNGYHILECNYRVGKMGEVDIIARDKEYICFVEVKTRTNTLFGLPSEAVGWRKQQGLIRLAQVYMKQHSLHNGNARFDVVEVLIAKDGQADVNLIRNAF